MARGIFSKIHYIFDQGDLDDNWDTGGLRPLRSYPGFGIRFCWRFRGVKGNGYKLRSRRGQERKQWLPDGLRRAAFVVEVTGRFEMRVTDGDRALRRRLSAAIS